MTTQPSTARPDVKVEPAVFWRWVWESVRPVLGYVLAGLGFLLLIIAYLGVSREVLVAKQIPYLVSGGLLGIACVTMGSRIMLIDDLRRDSGRLDRLEQAVTELRTVLLSRPDAPVEVTSSRVSRNGSSASTDHLADSLLVLQGGETFHRMGCRMVANKSGVSPVTPSAAREEGLKACRLCQPLAVGV